MRSPRLDPFGDQNNSTSETSSKFITNEETENKSSNGKGFVVRSEKKNGRSNSNEDRKNDPKDQMVGESTDIEIGKNGSKTFEILADNIPAQTSVGVCCMEKKLNSKPMQNILEQLGRYPDMNIICFSEDMILNKPVEEWPVTEAFICFYSSGFPIEKTLKYTSMHKPIQVNDLESQKVLWDRREIYKILKANNIPTARHFIVDRKA
jgi:hypothetical protein